MLEIDKEAFEITHALNGLSCVKTTKQKCIRVTLRLIIWNKQGPT
jgi:hypothetical protein